MELCRTSQLWSDLALITSADPNHISSVLLAFSWSRLDVHHPAMSVAQSDSCCRMALASLTRPLIYVACHRRTNGTYCVTAKHIADIFSVADEFEWTQDTALWNTAVQSRSCSQNTSVRERLRTAAAVRLEPVERSVSNCNSTTMKYRPTRCGSLDSS